MSKRLALVFLIAAALCGYIAVYSATDAQLDGTPFAGSPAGTSLPTPVRVGGAEPSPQSVLNPPELPACIECYFGLWQLSVHGDVEISPFGGDLMAFVGSGSVTVDPPVPGSGSSFDESSGAFGWLSDETRTVSTGDDSAILYFYGLVPGRGASDIAGLTLLGGAAFQAQPAQPYTFLIGKVTLDAGSQPLVFGPDTWPAILNVTAGDVQMTTARAPLIAEDRPVEVTSFDEFGPGVRILLPETLVQVTQPASPDSEAVLWFAGIYSSAPTGGPGCGWHCR